MPKIIAAKKLFTSLLGNKPTSAVLEKQLVCAKAEFDGEDSTNFKIELNDTNRPDLWTTAGLARQLRSYHKAHKASFPFFDEQSANNQEAEKYIEVDASIKKVRPYVCGFIIEGLVITQEILDELIQMQEKLSENFGQKRKAIAIGIYRETAIQWPIKYLAVDPETNMFTALDCDKPQTLKEIVDTHPKGTEYGHLIKDFPVYPIIKDSANEVLSMPPIINSAFLGAVKVGDKKIFIECTGDNLQNLLLTTNIFACDCNDLGFSVTRIETRYNYETTQGKTVIAPQKFQTSLSTTLQKAKDLLGTSLTAKSVEEALTKTGVHSEINSDIITIVPPPYRNDFLHEVDIIEDIMIGIGLENMSPKLPKNFTLGKIHPIEEISRRVISSMVGLGFQEMLFPYLGGRHMFISNMYPLRKNEEQESGTGKQKKLSEKQIEEETRIKQQKQEALENTILVSNPISEKYEIVRSSALPNLLEAERVSANSPYPHCMCEVGKIVLKDEKDNYGCVTNTHLSCLIASAEATFTKINSVIAAVLYYEDVLWHSEIVDDVRFIDKRVVKIIRDSDKVCLGVFGEIHPRVLHAFDITMPCVGGEICLDLLLQTK